MANPFKDALIEYTDNAIKNRKLEIINALKTNWAKDSLAALPRNAGMGALIGAGINGARGAIKGWRDAAAKTTIKPRNLWIPEQVVPASIEDKVVGALRRGSIDALKGAGIGAGIGAATSPLSPVVNAALRYRAEPERIQGVTDRAIAGAKEFLNLDRDLMSAKFGRGFSKVIDKDLAASLKDRYNEAMSNTSMIADTPVHSLAIMSEIQDLISKTKFDPNNTTVPDWEWFKGLKKTYLDTYKNPVELDKHRQDFSMTPLLDLKHSLNQAKIQLGL